MSILVVGSVAFDSIKTPHGEAPEILGGSASYFSLAASYFAPIRLVAVVGDDFGPQHREVFESRKIDLRGLETAPGKTFRWGGEYSADMNQRTTLFTHLNVFADFSPKIPAAYADSPYLFLGNIDPKLQYDVLSKVPQARLVACDTMNFWISGCRESLLETLRKVDILLINDQETRELAGENHLWKAAAAVRAMGPKILIVKRGEYGALMLSEGARFWLPALPLDVVRDPTGAGDSFAGGFMGYLCCCGLVSDAHLRKAMVYGSVMASFAVEDFGFGKLLGLSAREIAGRYREFKKLTEFGDEE